MLHSEDAGPDRTQCRSSWRSSMPTRQEYAKQPVANRLERIARTADDLAAAVGGRSDAVLSRRPDGKSWAAKEVVCHLRDLEELFMIRFRKIGRASCRERG